MAQYYFTARVKPSEADDGSTRYVARCLELPGTITDGATVKDALEDLTAAIKVTLDGDLAIVDKIRTEIEEAKVIRTPNLYSIVIDESELGKTIFSDVG